MRLGSVTFVAILAAFCALAARANGPSAGSVEEFAVQTGRGVISVRVLSPPADQIAKDPALLLTFAMDRATSLGKQPYSFAAEHFVAHGHRAASFDLPNHGDRIDKYGEAIEGMRNAFVAGDDPFAAFVADGAAVIDACIARGIANPGRIAVAGTSRGGYMALRLLAADRRVTAGAGFAPVTDWRELREFAADRDRADVAELQLTRFVPGMIGKRVFIAIGKTDTRVSTQRCEDFVAALADANRAGGKDPGLVAFHLTDDPGHSCGDAWYDLGRTALLWAVTGNGKTP